MKYRDALTELTKTEEQIDSLTQMYVMLMNKEYKSVSFGLTIEKEEEVKAEVDTDGYEFTLRPTMFWDFGSSRRSEPDNTEKAKFTIDPDIAMYVCQLEIQRLVDVRNDLVVLLNPKFNLPKRKRNANNI